jgi:hypothetical protein
MESIWATDGGQKLLQCANENNTVGKVRDAFSINDKHVIKLALDLISRQC